MAEPGVPVTIGRRPGGSPPVTELGRTLGESVGAMVRYLVSVIDREDRLEVGTGEWKASFTVDDEARRASVTESVLRSLRLAAEPVNFAILRALAAGTGRSVDAIAAEVGMARPAVDERISDLVSAGLVSKIPEAAQVVGSEAAVAFVAVVEEAVAVADRVLGEPA